MPRIAILLVLLLASAVRADDVPLVVEGNTEIVKVDQVITLKIDRTVVTAFPTFVKAPADIGFYRWTYPPTVKAVDKGHVLQIDAAPKGDLKIDIKVESAVVVDGKIKYITQFGSTVVSIGAPSPPIPPIPPIPPEPKPPEPKPPVPVTSFRVIFVYESAKTLPSAQIAVMDAKITRDYLTANTTPEGAYAGWRKYDKDQDSSKDQPTINAMWTATKPLITTVPCVAIEANGHVDILPLEATPAAQVEVFKKYKAGA